MQETALPPESDPAAGLVRTRYRVPRHDQSVLLLPGVSETAQPLQANRDHYNHANLDVWQKPLHQWRAAASREAIHRAHCYTSQLDQRPCSAYTLAGPIIAAGHQPELFHPGVWLKNLWAGRLAQQHHGVAINLVVDSDTVKSRAVQVPQRTGSSLRFRRVLIDDWQTGLPWQQLKVVNEELFRSFPDRLLEAAAGLLSAEGVFTFWNAVQQYRKRNDNLVSAFTFARRQMEQELGVDNLELPLSQLCQTETFFAFVGGVLLDASRFVAAYNRSLRQYRHTYGLRSNTHPMPDLTSQNGWQELPFWGWTETHPRRFPLYIRQTGHQLQLSDGESLQFSANLSNTGDRDDVTCILQRWHRQGLQIRPRALMTTLYFRLFVADWFIHGIGGAKYDEITDHIIEDYFGIPAPQMQVATGTFWLPGLSKKNTDAASAAELTQRLRYAVENPETLLNAGDQEELQSLIQRKKELIAEQRQQVTGLTKSERRRRRPENLQRHQNFQRIRSQLTELASAELKQLKQECEQAKTREANDRVAHYREYPFLFYSLTDRKRLAALLD